MRCFVITVCLLAFMNQASASDALCSDYARSKDEDRALFNGYIYGIVMAKIGDRGDAEVNTATARIKELTDKYCAQHPTESLTPLLGSFAKVVFNYGSQGNAPPSPWETHKQCEEMALKLNYPRKLNECRGDDCKGLTEAWMTEALKTKRECIRKKLG